MTFSLFLKCVPEPYQSVPEPYQSFCSQSLDCRRTLIYVCVLWLLFLIFCFQVVCWSTRIFGENEHAQTSQGQAKRRRRGEKPKGCRYHQREEEEKKILISILKSPLGQRHDSVHFRQLLCPDPSCEVCNNATFEMDQLLSSLALEDATPPVSPLASRAPVTEPLFTPSPAFSAVPAGDLTPPPRPEILPPLTSNLSLNSVTSLGDFLSPSPLDHSLPPEPFSSLESEFLVDYFPPQPLDFPSLPQHDTQNADPAVYSEAHLTRNTIFLGSSIN
uniref:SPATA31-like domain-containing protein n=1 Tax=Molossus molossus TaxID=27622 RepID=A0A7J8EFE7_MOLMO|nr:hypothetical protein HJG59_008865 [Molossus molossus]